MLQKIFILLALFLLFFIVFHHFPRNPRKLKISRGFSRNLKDFVQKQKNEELFGNDEGNEGTLEEKMKTNMKNK